MRNAITSILNTNKEVNTTDALNEVSQILDGRDVATEVGYYPLET